MTIGTAALAVITLVLLWYIARLRKQIRCLGWCYIDRTEWAARTINNAREACIHENGEDRTPFALLQAEDHLTKQTARHRAHFAKVGLREPGEAERVYLAEDL